ncbi:hypothetical protein TSUD_18030 [Trifolium subterraneum]|uniref:Uncharacterized protein n=1 Tax=Trifolium subterraneum TaxID=3900 RepID=A0A2Z6MP40_TRISU|nr:hypothetical protein TSUD_18030 [Trifolium subterraneum]
MEYSAMDKGISGVAGVVYGLLGGLTLGTWLLQIGFSLYTDVFGLQGCKKISISSLTPQMENIDVQCDLDEDSLRGIAMMELLFILHAIVVLVLVLGLFGVLAGNRNLRGGETKGPLLSESDVSELEMG